MRNEMMVQTDSGSLHAQLIGEDLGRPTIIMEAGYGDDATTWETVIGKVSLISQVLIYDRAGLGKSSGSSYTKTSRELMKDLKELLIKADIQPPYLLAGHSFGGGIAQMYAATYPEEVCGLILIDATPADYRERFLPTMSPDFQKAYNKQFGSEERFTAFTESLNQLQEIKQKLSIPVIVLAAGKKEHYSKESQMLWNKMQEEIADISTKGEFIIAPNSAHYIHHDEPEIVVSAITKLIMANR